MADHTNDHTTYVERERVERAHEGRSGTGIAFIVGGLLVAVIVLVLLFTGGDFGMDSSPTNVNVEGDAPSAIIVPDAEPAPADPAAPAADAEAPAPSTDGDTAAPTAN